MLIGNRVYDPGRGSIYNLTCVLVNPALKGSKCNICIEMYLVFSSHCVEGMLQTLGCRPCNVSGSDTHILSEEVKY